MPHPDKEISEYDKKERQQAYKDIGGPEPTESNATDRQVLGMIQNLAKSLLIKRDTAVRARAACGIEQVWREDELLFEGVDEATVRVRMIDYAMQTNRPRGQSGGPKRSAVYINVVRPKCETAEGRFADVQLPTDDKNWGLKVTPVPKLSESLGDKTPASIKGSGQELKDDQGNVVSMGDIAAKTQTKAEKKMSGMEKRIEDQLTQCNYNAECRKAIILSCRLGTGILKGPVNAKSLEKNWVKRTNGEKTVRVLQHSEKTQPVSYSKSPWDVFPDPDCEEDINKAGYIWDREACSARDLRNLLKVDGYLHDQIEAVLKEEPTRVIVASPKENQFIIRYSALPSGNVYERWEYNGDLNTEDLETLGVDTTGVITQSVGACVQMVNERPIKAQLNTLDTGDLPFDFFTWASRTGVPWGTGLPREMAWQQRVLVSAWRTMMDNAGDSAGAQLVIGKGVKPADGVMEVTGKKLWYAQGNHDDVRKAFTQFQLQNNQEDLQRIVDLVLRFIDIETNMPMLFSGEKGEMPETLGATNIMVDSNNVAFRSRVKLWDDNVTRRHLTRYYDWNMQYDEDDDIKGDYQVDPRGVSILKEKDQEAQSIEDILAIRNDPQLSAMVDWTKAVKDYFGARNMDILLPEDEIKEKLRELEKQQPPADPALEAAKIRADADMKKAEAAMKAATAKILSDREDAEINRAHELQMRYIDREIKAMELAAASGDSLAKIKAQLTEASAKLQVQVKLATDKNVQEAEQIAEPMVEPAGRAAPGHAFQD